MPDNVIKDDQDASSMSPIWEHCCLQFQLMIVKNLIRWYQRKCFGMQLWHLLQTDRLSNVWQMTIAWTNHFKEESYMTSVKKNQVLAISQVFKTTWFRLNSHESLLPALEMKEIHVELCGKSRIEPKEIELLALQICINYHLIVQTRIVHTHTHIHKI